MLFRRKFLDGIREGRITVAFRRWKRPSVRTGGTLLTSLGQLSIDSVSLETFEGISPEDAGRAGYESREDLIRELERRGGGDLYRIELGVLRADPRVALRDTIPNDADALSQLGEKLKRLDARSASGAWTHATLKLIASHPGMRAGDLCAKLGQEKPHFKRNVRKLKSHGLTESLDVGYRLSPRGAALLESMRGQTR